MLYSKYLPEFYLVCKCVHVAQFLVNGGYIRYISLCTENVHVAIFRIQRLDQAVANENFNLHLPVSVIQISEIK